MLAFVATVFLVFADGTAEFKNATYPQDLDTCKQQVQMFNEIFSQDPTVTVFRAACLPIEFKVV